MESLGLGLCNRVSHDAENYVLVVVLYLLLSRTHRKVYTAVVRFWKCREEREGAKGSTVRVVDTTRDWVALHLALFAH
jgi:hypothetical protein